MRERVYQSCRSAPFPPLAATANCRTRINIGIFLLAGIIIELPEREVWTALIINCKSDDRAQWKARKLL